LDRHGELVRATDTRKGRSPEGAVDDLDRLVSGKVSRRANTTVYAQARVFELAARSGIK